MDYIIKKEINSYEVEIYGKSALHIHINHKNKDTGNISHQRYKNKIILLDYLKKTKEFESDEKFQKYKDFSFIKKNNNMTIEKDGNNLILSIEIPKHKNHIIALFELLNVKYYLAYGPKHKRKNNNNPFYTSLNRETFNLNDIKTILEKDKIINKYKIISFRYFDESLNGFVKIDDYKDYKMPKNNLILELYFNEYINNLNFDLEKLGNNMTNEITSIKNKIKISRNLREYDLIYLYASPIIDKINEKETNKPINYRMEIKKLIKLFNESGKAFNCLFECANELTFKEVLKKKTKILHISSHGDIDDNQKYKLKLEENGKEQILKYDILEKIIKANKNNLKNIDLVFVSTCHSQQLGELFLDNGVKNVIFVESINQISNVCALKLLEYLYDELIKGHCIQESFENSMKKLKDDREVISYNLKQNTCENHKHKKTCKKICKGKKICDCFYDQFHKHKLNCKFHLKMQKEDKIKDLDIFEDDKRYIKICCCDHTINHCEYLKYKLVTKNDVAPFQFNEKGILYKNKNACVKDFEERKNLSIIGRAKQIERIYHIINDYRENIHFFILYGEKEIGKQDFAEALCVYLFERKIIQKFENFELKTKPDLVDIKNKIFNYSKYIKEKSIIIIKISYLLDEKKSFDFVNTLLKDINVDNNNLFYFIILSTQKEKIDSKIQGKNRELIDLKLDINMGMYLLRNLCDYLGCKYNFEQLNDLDKLLNLIKFRPKKIKILSELIDKGYNYEELKEFIDSKKIDEQREVTKKEQLIQRSDISRIYFLLSFMPSGLPDSLLQLIIQGCHKIIMEENENNRLIYKDPDNNWNYINDCKKEINNIFADKDKKNEKKEIILQCLKVYSTLLFFYIDKNRQNICFPDNNIHYIFNSYNGTGIWKSFDIEMYKYCFYDSKRKKYENIINYDFDLEKHSKNIINFMKYNLEEIKDLLKTNDINKEYIEQILIMLPSCYFLKKECKNIIMQCIYICQELSLDNDENRLLLFLYSLEGNPRIDLDKFKNFELNLEALFLLFLKKKDKNSFDKIEEEYEKAKNGAYGGNNNINDIKLKFAECNYEKAGTYYLKTENNQKLNQCKNYLIKAKNIAKEINNHFFMDRINIDLFFVSKKQNEDNFGEFLDEVIKKKNTYPYNYMKLQSNIINEAYRLKNKLNENFDSDILILNSNPLKSYLSSALNNDIFSYHNNQYYLLEQLNEKIRSNIKVESHVLNKENLQIDLNKKGKLLILQSDDFTEKGEIILETDNGESQILSIEDLKKLLPVKIKFDILILCFINSEKLKELFEDKVKYLITLDYIDCFELDEEKLLKYNKLCMDFIINFIEKVTEFTEKNEDNIKESFEIARTIFIKELKGNEQNTEYINLTIKNNLNSFIEFKNSKTNGRIILNNPLLNLPSKTPLFKYYSDEIFNLIKIILSEDSQYINIYLNNDIRFFEKNKRKINKKTIISIELMKYFYRHQTFNRTYFINYVKKLGNSLYDIVNDILKKEKKEKNIIKKNKKYSCFVLINNYNRKELIIEDSYINYFQYLIMSKDKIIIVKNKSDIIKKSKKDEIIYINKDFPIVSKKLKEHPNKIIKNDDNFNNDKDLQKLNSIFDISLDSGENSSNESEDFDNNSQDI